MQTNDLKDKPESVARVESSALLGGKWKYFRDAKNKVSKWTLGNNWVTKWDKDRFCIIGLNGQRTDWKVDAPDAARESIECAIMPHNARADLPPTGARGPRSGTEGAIGG